MIARDPGVPTKFVVIFIVVSVIIFVLTVAGCAPKPRCQILGSLELRRDIEVCEWESRKECRDLSDGKFVRCPK